MTTDNDKHCFKSNPKNKEIITVNANHIEFAIDHFHTRLMTADVTIYRTNEGNYLRTKVTSNVHMKLEVANCYFKSSAGLFRNNEIVYTSFRLAD